MRRESCILLVVILGGVAGGCAPAAAGPGMSRMMAADRSTTTLEVENRAWNALNIYVVSDAGRYRLGRVDGASTATFSLPGHLLSGSVQLLAGPIGSMTGHLSEPVSFSPGQQAHWRLEDTVGQPFPRHSMLSFTVVPARARH